MKVVGLQILDEFASQHGDIRGQISAWINEVEAANWQTPTDIRAKYASASFLADNNIIFDIKGKRYRMQVKISYKNKIVLIKRIGTHAEYSKWKLI